MSGQEPLAPVYHAYLRVSTRQQAESGLGLEAQREAIQRWCGEQSSVGTVRWHVDEGVSGTVAPHKRPGLCQLLAELQAGDVLVVAKRDRLGRESFVLASIEHYVAKQGARVASTAGEGTEDDDPTSVLMRRMLDAFAEYERLLIGARTKAALAAKAAQGYHLGKAPYGWSVSDGVLEIAPEEQRVLGYALSARERGYTLREVVEALNAGGARARGGKPWTKGSLSRILSRVEADEGARQLALASAPS